MRQRRADVRLIAASNADLQEMVERGHFRRDLLYRLNSVQLQLPPLRARGPDILQIAEHHLKRQAARAGQPSKQLSEEAQQVLLHQAWPGNVRELTHLMERCQLMVSGPTIQAQDLALPGSAPSFPQGSDSARTASPAPSLDELTLEDAERLLISTALRRASGNALNAAKALGLSRSAFYRRLEKYPL